MSLIDDQWAFLKDLAKLIAFAEGQGMILTGGELWRTKEQQDIYLSKGLSKTKNSKHLVRCAVDLNLIVNGQLASTREEYKLLGTFWEGLSPLNRWGGNFISFTDAPHFERNVI